MAAADKTPEVKSADPAVGVASVDAEAAKEGGIKVPSDLSKVSDPKAKELVEAGVVQDSDVPGKMYRRKADGFVARIPNYTFNAYIDVHKDEWEEIQLTTEAPPDEGQSA